MKSRLLLFIGPLLLALGAVFCVPTETEAKPRKKSPKVKKPAGQTRESPKADEAPEAKGAPGEPEDAPETEAVKSKPGEWVRLYDGTPAFFDTFLSYHFYPKRRPPERVWRIQEDGTLYQCPFQLNGSGRGGTSKRSFIVSKDESFADFELEVVLKFGEPGAGTHIYYRADPEDKKPFVKGFEYTVNHPDAEVEDPKHRTGALADIIAPEADPGGVMKNDDWNVIRIRAIGNVIEHYLNDQLMCRFDISTDAFKEAVAKSRRADREGWGQLRAGSIGIGDTRLSGAQIYYKEIRIREL